MTAAWWGVLIAFAGALAYASGAAIQQLEAVELGATAKLMRRPRWWLGGAISFAGACMHAVALSMAPLTIIQPVSVTTLVFAVPLAAKLHNRRPRAAEIWGSLAVSVGLGGLMVLVPVHHSTPSLPDLTAVALLAGVLGFIVVTQLLSRRLTGPGKAALLACSAGIATGTVSTFVRLVGSGLQSDLSTLLHWFTIVIPAMLIVATILLQKSYAVGYFGIAYAVTQVSDPIASVLADAGLLGEPLPTDPSLIAPAVVAAFLLIGGTVLLGRNAPDLAHKTEPATEPETTTEDAGSILSEPVELNPRPLRNPVSTRRD
ncbi:DMT family transporter [Stackebrandtia soli]|uniref:DMT family transporter n=1 Tax=Stackebrandtia soli TaxID=1892856 RepID=UPI0039E8FBFE